MRRADRRLGRLLESEEDHDERNTLVAFGCPWPGNGLWHARPFTVMPLAAADILLKPAAGLYLLRYRSAPG
jgi:hypothetical protein